MKKLVEDLKIANDNLYCANKMLEEEIERLKEENECMSYKIDWLEQKLRDTNNIINELEKYCNEEIEDYDKNIKSQYITDIAREQYEGEKVCFEDMLYKLKELKGSDKE